MYGVESSVKAVELFAFISCICFFFFQAEDGIRDVAVTGVQTCALPISEPRPSFRASRSYRLDAAQDAAQRGLDHHPAPVLQHPNHLVPWHEGIRRQWIERSEERRVGKECRRGGGRGAQKKIWCMAGLWR